jgi:two-component system sensor histidine kinase and response regulator WspE
MSDTNDFSLMDLFREEVRTHAATLNQGLVDLENDPANAQNIEPLMRAAHSIKGAARIVNIDAAVQLAHVMEDALVAAQAGGLRITPADIDLLLRGTDLLARLGEVGENEVAAWSAANAAEAADLGERFRRMAQGQPSPAAPTPPAPAPRPAVVIPRQPLPSGPDSSMADLFREEVRTAALALNDSLPQLQGGPVDQAQVEGLAQVARSITEAARIMRVEPLAQLSQTLEEFFAGVRLGSTSPGQGDADLLAEAIGFLGGIIRVGEDDLPAWLEEHGGQIGQLCERLGGRVPKPAPVPSVPVTAPPLPQPKTEPARQLVTEAPAEERPPAPAETVAAAEAVVRVTAQSLNRLLGLAGEALVQGRWLDPFATALLKLKKQQDHLAAVLDGLKQALAAGGQPDRVESLAAEARRQSALCRETLGERIGEFQDHAAQVEDLSGRLYREVIASRMRPFGDGTGGFARLVRDMARRLDKPVRLEIDGQTTAVDRDILERLEAPLTHLLRNAVDHGIEPVAERTAAGKPETGLVRIEAGHRAGTLAITVTDDGRGIDLERLRAKVVERGLTTADLARTMTEAELLDFLFLPGYSTAAALTEYSGRGVGLDVVQTMVRKVGGSVRVSTQPGKGTRFHLHLPLTLSVLRAVLVDIAGEFYAFPHNRIDRLVRVPLAEVRSLEQRQFVTVGGQNVGLVLAAQLLDLPPAGPSPPGGVGKVNGASDELPVVLLSDQTGTYGLIVEAFRGEQDLVVRPLDPRLGKVPNISAAAILDDGSPVLIADVEDLIRSMDRFIQGNTLRRSGRDGQVATPAKRVLVVDDSITVRELERQLLRNHGYDVSVAVDGQEGWNLVRAESFDLVISDVDMPRMNGLELVRAIRADPGLREVPVIIVSYKEREEDRLRGLEVGANYYLTKSSFHDHTFLQAVTDLICES